MRSDAGKPRAKYRKRQKPTVDEDWFRRCLTAAGRGKPKAAKQRRRSADRWRSKL